MHVPATPGKSPFIMTPLYMWGFENNVEHGLKRMVQCRPYVKMGVSCGPARYVRYVEHGLNRIMPLRKF